MKGKEKEKDQKTAKYVGCTDFEFPSPYLDSHLSFENITPIPKFELKYFFTQCKKDFNNKYVGIKKFWI